MASHSGDPLPDLYRDRNWTETEASQDLKGEDQWVQTIITASHMRDAGASMEDVYEEFGGRDNLERIIGPDAIDELMIG